MSYFGKICALYRYQYIMKFIYLPVNKILYIILDEFNKEFFTELHYMQSKSRLGNGNGNGNENISNAPPTVDRRRMS